MALGRNGFPSGRAVICARGLALVFGQEGVHETAAGQVALCLFIEREGFLMAESFAGAYGIDLADKPAVLVIPLAVLLHEGVDLTPAGSSGSEHENIALGHAFDRLISLIKGLDHTLIIGGRRAGGSQIVR